MVAATLGDGGAGNAVRRGREDGAAGPGARCGGVGKAVRRLASGARCSASPLRGRGTTGSGACATGPGTRHGAAGGPAAPRWGCGGECGYGRAWTCAPTAFDQALPAVASQLVDQVMAPRRVGHAWAGLKVPQPVSLVRQSIALFTTAGAT